MVTFQRALAITAKPHNTEVAKEIFSDTGIVISTEGQCYLGGAVGTCSFVHQHVEQKAECWANELETLC